MGNRLGHVRPDGMWKLVFYQRAGLRVVVDRTGPWLPSREVAHAWAQFFLREGYHVSLQAQDGQIERLSPSIPG